MINLEIIKIPYNEIGNEAYQSIYSEIFNHVDINQIPDNVYVGFIDSKYVGFVSTNTIKINTVEIRYAGFVDDYKGYRSPGLFIKVVERIHEDYEYITFRIHNQNIPSIKVALCAGFVIFGIRYPQEGDKIVVLVELISKRKELNG